MRFSIALLLTYSFATSLRTASANDDLAIDLGRDNATTDWILLDKSASLENGTLILDGRQKISRAFYSPLEWSDVKLTAKFFVEPQPRGVLSCAFIVRAVDGSSYYYVHFDRGQAILDRHSEAREWTEIKRASGLKKPAGEWHEGQVECSGNTLRVSLNGDQLYEVQDDNLKGGRIGFYGSQGLVRVKDIRVSGASSKPAADFHVPLPSYSFVCEDAGAGGYEAFPDICHLNDGRLMCVFYAGYGHIALPNEQLPKGGRISYCLSDDEGRTWSDAATLYDGPDDDRDPSIVQTKSGRLICNFFSLRKGPTGKKYTSLGSWIITSDDMGTTWSEPQQISESQYCSSPIRQLTDGRLILGLYTGAKSDSQGAVVFSDNDGDTWQPEVLIDNAGVRLDAETDLIELRDGTLYAAQRPQMAYSTSKDRGATWSVSKPMGFPGHCPYFLRTKDDVIVLAFRIPNTSLRFSRDECQSWSDNIVVDGVIGAYPSMVNLKDGSVRIVYYEEGGGSSIRSKRFRITESGLEWIPPSQ